MKRKNKFSDWREDLIEIKGIPEKEVMDDTESEKEITEKKIKNKIIINPQMKEAFAAIGGEVLEVVELDEKDSYKTVAAVIDYDRSKKGSKDATYDSDHGKKKAAKKERDYAAWEREKMKRDDPNWKHKKYHTGMHGEEVEDLGNNKLDEKIDIEKADMGDVVDDFYKSDAPQFKGKSKKKRREMAIAAKLNTEDKAFDNVVGMLRKKHGESGVLTKDSPKSKVQSQPKTKPEKKTRSEVDAQYGRTPWNKKGSLGT